jgi:hypothetical protein
LQPLCALQHLRSQTLGTGGTSTSDIWLLNSAKSTIFANRQRQRNPLTQSDVAGSEISATDEEKGKKVTPQTPLSVGTLEDLHNLALVCAKFLLEHNAEPDAVDLLEEMEIIDRIVDLVDANTFNRVAAYMIA